MKSKSYSRKERNRNYWRNRFEQLEESQFKKSEDYYHELKYQYQRALSDIESDIMMWYQRFALNNEASMSEVKKLLNSKELLELRWTVQEYIKYGKENALNQNWMKELENASSRAHITRLEALKLQIQQHIEVLYNSEIEGVETIMKDIYADGYYHTAFEIHKGIGIATNFSRLDDKLISKVIKKPWTSDGINFSERIWGKHRPQLIEELHKQLTQTIIQGRDPQYAINVIAKKFDVSKRQAGNLIMTESAFFAAQSKKDCFNELDIDQFEVVSTLDIKTSNICQELDGEVFDMDDYEVGVTSPPFHNYCRTTTAPYFEDEEEYGTRVARDSYGNVYTVPNNMKYSEWYDKHVKDNPIEEAEVKKLKNKSNDKKQHKRYLEVLGDDIPKSFDKFQELKYNKVKEWDKISYNYKINTIYNLDKLKNIDNFAGKKAIKHILEGEVNRNNPKRIRAVGYHLENMPNTRAIISGDRFLPDRNGIYRAAVEIEGIIKNDGSSFFPINWTPQQVVDAINEAYENKVAINKDGTKFKGFSKSGIKIEMYVINGKITTAFPKYNEME